ncbi:toll/interleukin-1 receptor-like protein [Daucus carota subsp. sativus]|uniref:toll/interleukin-1 receptor-like protein n=1 Tax=Daucus carota subsp. sativus TaxID=79200 RepID=UPI0030827EDA
MSMASASNNQASSSSSSTLHPTKWDVFLSFRGKDTRYTFTDYLYHSLQRNGIKTFRDAPNIRSGEIITSALFQAIQDSKIYIVVLSQNFASSQYCLDELVEILSCRGKLDRLLIPVFYCIEPSVVKYQTGSYGEAFRKHGNYHGPDLLDKWRATLRKVGEFSGYHVRENTFQVDVINEITDRVLQEINTMPSALEVAQYLGMNSPVKDEATLSSNVTAGVHNQNNGPFKGSMQS